MSGEFIAFFVLALLTIGGAVFMISFTRVVHMVVALAFTFLGIAGLYVLLEAEFVGVTQVLVYSGAISILMLFGIMLTRHDATEVTERKGPFKYIAFAGIAVFFIVAFLGIQSAHWGDQQADFTKQNNVKEIGIQLFTHYVIPFEAVSVLLLVALVGAIILAKKEAEDE
ncbi:MULTISPECIES: NADH-quinone oxidoreductase subunit J [Aneurinibacillus]|uniref:NADH-quinone oxidoreductase subunit J n=1 Tax=Aneurinibacillus thermoaerophilus TaxID=143495 RepID=A0A1G8A068_ANETH|nr:MULTISPECIES: NADH-quinone oxidoreductase subunit J [Aneurinibacillus]AMA71651.1 NADH:ubiquinone oxidoreductase subunit J [Aneurinibacillus sp. XH2]MED0680802.1 NADH-quinone oxidoreductase subunit J [Aneurinibacillus thermoaerophilus]MED0738363.1 NADH-quinone oxidoreductase subunit J [Aneurinibacillus thermoaerophilus]MED0757635.1 NADH-quinone oxidoreductase subunit J [Aneurinibacillus thermoaerophilus]MED0759274.1 NADH-quinone oxidoreductase subunit J [Aneurinibacillus thermoaerophilus]